MIIILTWNTYVTINEHKNEFIWTSKAYNHSTSTSDWLWYELLELLEFDFKYLFAIKLVKEANSIPTKSQSTQRE